MKRLSLLFIITLCFVSAHAQDKPYVLLVSFDGFRHDYVKRFDLPNFKAFIREGSQAVALVPSFPSKTFPNHYTLVTGLYPGHHGLVDNTFYDKSRDEVFTMKNKDRVTDKYYFGGTPLWRLARENGIKSASYFWTGSEVKDDGLHPDYFESYNEQVPFEDRIEKVIQWLSLSESDRPHFITLYFSSPDHESHLYGPLAEETKTVVQRMDSLLGILMTRVKETALPVNVVLVSDHGMKAIEVKDANYVFLDEVLPVAKGGVKVVNDGSQTHLYTRSKATHDSLYVALKKNQPRAAPASYRVLSKEEYPSAWGYTNERSGDIMIVAEPGYYIVDKNRRSFIDSKKDKTFGVHGYDAAKEKDVHGIFYAQGPNIKRGFILPSFENIHVYPFIASLLQIKTLPPIDGKIEVLQQIYKP